MTPKTVLGFCPKTDPKCNGHTLGALFKIHHLWFCYAQMKNIHHPVLGRSKLNHALGPQVWCAWRQLSSDQETHTKIRSPFDGCSNSQVPYLCIGSMCIDRQALVYPSNQLSLDTPTRMMEFLSRLYMCLSTIYPWTNEQDANAYLPVHMYMYVHIYIQMWQSSKYQTAGKGGGLIVTRCTQLHSRAIFQSQGLPEMMNFHCKKKNVYMYIYIYGKCLGFARNRNHDRQRIIIIIIIVVVVVVIIIIIINTIIIIVVVVIIIIVVVIITIIIIIVVVVIIIIIVVVVVIIIIINTIIIIIIVIVIVIVIWSSSSSSSPSSSSSSNPCWRSSK